MLGLGHGRAQVQHVRIGGTREGAVLAYRIEVLQDTGAYAGFGAVLPFMTRMMTSGPYKIPGPSARAIRWSPIRRRPRRIAGPAARGHGRHRADHGPVRARNRHGPAELRRRNLIEKDDFPYTTPVDTVYDVGDYHRALDLALEVAGYDDLRAEQVRRRTAGDVRQLGIGCRATWRSRTDCPMVSSAPSKFDRTAGDRGAREPRRTVKGT